MFYRGICDCDPVVLSIIDPVIPQMVDGYLHLYEEARQYHNEYFGYRDFYRCYYTKFNEITFLITGHAITFISNMLLMYKTGKLCLLLVG